MPADLLLNCFRNLSKNDYKKVAPVCQIFAKIISNLLIPVNKKLTAGEVCIFAKHGSIELVLKAIDAYWRSLSTKKVPTSQSKTSIFLTLPDQFYTELLQKYGKDPESFRSLIVEKIVNVRVLNKIISNLPLLSREVVEILFDYVKQNQEHITKENLIGFCEQFSLANICPDEILSNILKDNSKNEIFLLNENFPKKLINMAPSECANCIEKICKNEDDCSADELIIKTLDSISKDKTDAFSAGLDNYTYILKCVLDQQTKDSKLYLTEKSIVPIVEKGDRHFYELLFKNEILMSSFFGDSLSSAQKEKNYKIFKNTARDAGNKPGVAFLHENKKKILNSGSSCTIS